ncbi:MAG: chorismate mutase [Planctomycetes bacterium]|jgi:chorismate mutase|nr:chorismate mutase [Planctomycetota bacterium]MBT4027891.1 chorismate mutase [Planctomycetota bacterium]MBT4560006.1 chorismate mutase [Planctomycetota bacterium]MBT5100779.1 chorismate mutase [Planctomycetota bacterium]MBT7011330.1 chorismate mutase [Planctomycetota bacterium]
MSETDPLTEARKLIDIIDDKMLDLLVQRSRLSVVAARAKAAASADTAIDLDKDKPAIDQVREDEILTRICERASEASLDLCTTEDIFRAVLAFSRAHQK